MATINGVPFNIIKKRTTIINNNIVKALPMSDETIIKHNGYTTEPMTITAFVYNKKEFDDFKEQFYSDSELTLVLDDPNTQYTVRGGLALTEIDGDDKESLDINFVAQFELKTPYTESVATITRSKSITTQNQEWSADDDSIDIKTVGNVDAVPDIKVTGGLANAVDISQTTSNWSQALSPALGQTFKPTGTKITRIDVRTRWEDNWGAGTNITLNIYDSVSKNTLLGSETVFISAPNTTYTYNFDPEVEIVPGTMYMEFGASGTGGRMGSSSTDTYADGQLYNGGTPDPNRDLYMVIYTDSGTAKDIIIYNTADTTTKLNLTNNVLSDTIHRINVDGSGTIDYDDDFSTGKYDLDSTNSGCSYDYINDELDIADDGYIYWEIDSKYPIKNIPTLTAQINNTAATLPTIQISSNGTTWYDIDTVVVDDVDTVYPLDSDGNLSLAGKSLFYFRIDCATAAVTQGCSVKSFELDIDIHTIYAKNPKITKGSSASTFRCDQDAGSGMNCLIDLIFKHRWWA